jgi:very-short-patch-repair endonuclease
VWLFHSMHPEDFNTDDVRYKLLTHYFNPITSFAGEPDWSLCESGFEEAVARMIYVRGYRLRLQFEPFGPGGKRIDIVVEGLESRLAVECDGDAFHTSPEDIHNDLVRQRQLERCGWTFWRVGETNFRLDREKALSSLWAALDAMGIKPADQTPTQPPPPAAVHPASPPSPSLSVASPKTPSMLPTRPPAAVQAQFDVPVAGDQAEFSVDSNPRSQHTPSERELERWRNIIVQLGSVVDQDFALNPAELAELSSYSHPLQRQAEEIRLRDAIARRENIELRERSKPRSADSVETLRAQVRGILGKAPRRQLETCVLILEVSRLTRSDKRVVERAIRDMVKSGELAEGPNYIRLG